MCRIAWISKELARQAPTLIKNLVAANGANHGVGAAVYVGGRIKKEVLSAPMTDKVAEPTGNWQWAIAHVRTASVGGICSDFVQPFVWATGGADGQIAFAHNGTWGEYKSLILPILQAGYELPAMINDSKLISIALAIWGDAILNLPDRAAYIYCVGGRVIARTIGHADMCVHKSLPLAASEPIFGADADWLEFAPDTMLQLWPRRELVCGTLRQFKRIPPPIRRNIYDYLFDWPPKKQERGANRK